MYSIFSMSRKIYFPGINLQNVFTLRTLVDAGEINSALTSESNVVIYGSSFIGKLTILIVINVVSIYSQLLCF